MHTKIAKCINEIEQISNNCDIGLDIYYIDNSTKGKAVVVVFFYLLQDKRYNKKYDEIYDYISTTTTKAINIQQNHWKQIKHV